MTAKEYMVENIKDISIPHEISEVFTCAYNSLQDKNKTLPTLKFTKKGVWVVNCPDQGVKFCMENNFWYKTYPNKPVEDQFEETDYIKSIEEASVVGA